MLHLFLQFQATSSNSSFGEPGPHPIHTGRIFSSLGKLTSWKCLPTLPKSQCISSSRISFSGGNKLRFFRDHFLLESSRSTGSSRPTKKTKHRPRWVLWSPASRLQLHKSQENDPAWSSIKQIGRNENGLRVDGEELVSPKKGWWQRKRTCQTNKRKQQKWNITILTSGKFRSWILPGFSWKGGNISPKKFPNSKEIKACAFLDGKKRQETSLKTSLVG